MSSTNHCSLTYKPFAKIFLILFLLLVSPKDPVPAHSVPTSLSETISRSLLFSSMGITTTGDIHYVAPGANCGLATPCYGTIQAAIDAAVSGDEIRVAAGTYSDVQSRPRNDVSTTGTVMQVAYVNKSVMLNGGYSITDWSISEPASNLTLLHAQGEGRVIYVTGDVTFKATGLTIVGGTATGQSGDSEGEAGGGIYVYSADVLLRNVTISFNHAYTVADLICPQTSPNSYGGGIYISSNGTLILDSSTVSNNLAIARSGACTGGGHGHGGGIFNLGWMEVLNSTISNNVARGSDDFVGGVGYGAGIYNAEGASLKISGSLIAENGAIGGDSSFGAVAGQGGGVFNKAIAEIVNSTISSNSAVNVGDNNVGFGGGIYSDSSATTVFNNATISSNQGSVGANIHGETVTRNTIVAYSVNATNCSEALISEGYNLSDDNSCTLNATGDVMNKDPKLSVLGDNNGATLTHALLPDSPAIDAGNPAIPTSSHKACLREDQRGLVRPIDGNGDSVSRCDIGAYEYGSTHPPSFVYLPMTLRSYTNP